MDNNYNYNNYNNQNTTNNNFNNGNYNDYNNYNSQNNNQKKSSGSPVSGIISLLLIGIIIFVGLISFNVIDNPFSFMKRDVDNSITISPKEVTLKRGSSEQLTSQTTAGSVLYKSSDESIVSVNEISGYIIGKKAGTATITAYVKENPSIKDECTVTVESQEATNEVQSITLSNSSLNLSVGNSKVLTYRVSPSDANIRKIYWSTSNKNIASIDKHGVVKGLKEGTAKITIRTENGSTATCNVTITKESTPSSTPQPTPKTTPKKTPTPQNDNVTKITVLESTMKTKTNSNKAISYTVEPSTASNKNVTFKSSDEKVAKVDASGNVTGVGSGLATITITSQENSNITAKLNVVVDYPYFDNCKVEKANTLVNVKSTSSRNIGVYACIENQEYFQQGFAVSDNYIYTVNLRYGTWCKKGATNTFKLRGQTALTASCDPSDNNTILYISGNRIYRTSKSGAVDTVNYLDLGGHGQAFDVSSNDEIYANYFPHATYHDYYGYGGGPSGVAVFKFGNDKSFVDPKLAIKVDNQGNIKKFSYPGTISQHNDVLNESKKSDSISGWMELAVDESNDLIAVMDRAKTSNNYVLYVYKLSQFKAGNKQLVRKVYIGRVCGENNILCASQGIELKGNYLYTVQEYDAGGKHYESTTKIDLSSCPTSDTSTKCSKVESINIPDSIYNKGDRKLSEVEGISINKNKIYISVIDKSSSTNKTYENILLLDGF